MQRGGSWCGRSAALGLWLLLGSAAVQAQPVAPSSSDSLRSALPFVPVRGPGDRFVASNLSKTYDRDLLHLLNPEAARIRADLALLDRYGQAPRHRVPVEVDSSNVRVVDAGKPDQISREEKEKLEPPAPPIKTTIPDAVASTASILGGLALLVKILSEMIR